MRRYLAALIVAGAASMVVPSTAFAGSVSATVSVRVFDPFRHDYHRWDRREERSYRAYLAERHHSYVAYRRQRIGERRAYWQWRHERDERLEHRRR